MIPDLFVLKELFRGGVAIPQVLRDGGMCDKSKMYIKPVAQSGIVRQRLLITFAS